MIIRFAMIGGGYDSWIGRIHRNAAALDAEIALVSGCFSSSASKSKEFAQEHCPSISQDRIYADYKV